jgi:hypothetical protein
VTQITNLTLLAPEIQELVLSLTDDGGAAPIRERELQQVVSVPAWPEQRTALLGHLAST